MRRAARNALDRVGALVVVLDGDGRLRWWNRAYAALVGYEAPASHAPHVTELVPPGERQGLMRALSELQARGRATFEHSVLTSTGEARWIVWSSCLLGDGDARNIVSTGIDRTEEHAAVTELRASEHQLRELMCISADAIVWLDEHRRITFFNEGGEKIWGYRADEVIGTEVDLLMPVDRRHELNEAMTLFQTYDEQSLRIGANVDVRGLRKDGSEFHGDLILAKVRSQARWTFVLAMRDITARKRAEQEQRFFAALGRALTSSLEQHEILAKVAELVVGSLADCCVVDLLTANGVGRLTVAHADPAKRWLTEELRTIELDRSSRHPICAAIAKRRPYLVPVVDDETLVKMAQSPRHLELLRALAPRSFLAIPLFGRERLLGAMLLFSTTPRRYQDDAIPFADELGRSVSLAVDNSGLYHALEQALRARDEVLGVVAHDLRSPLSAIEMTTRVLGASCVSVPRAQRAIVIIERATKRMGSLIADLLDIARVEAGQLGLRIRACDAGELVNEAVLGVQPLAEDAGVSIVVHAPEEQVTLQADKLRCVQVLANLLGNALKFTPRGGRVDVIIERHRQHAFFVVRDNGPGISPEAKKHLFEPFWQRRRSSRESAGLGLAIARAVVLAHSGDIGVESDLGRGSSFWFRIPLRAARWAEEGRDHAPAP